MQNKNTNPIIRIAALLVLIFAFKGAGNGLAGSLSISWNPIQDSRLAGYKIKYGTTSGIYSQSANVGNVTSYIVPNLTEGTKYYFVIVGYDTSQVEGQPSTEVSGVVLASTAVNATSITASGAVITWTTNKPSDSQTDYGTTTAYGTSTTLDPTQVTSHSQSLANLTAGTTYNYRIRSKDAGGSVTVSSNFTFKTQATPANLSITSISPTRGLAGTTVVISGIGFGTAQGTSQVTFNGVAATASAWSDTSITVTVPQNASSGNIVVTVNGVQSNGVYFKVGKSIGKPPKIRVS